MMHHICKTAAFIGLNTPECEEFNAAQNAMKEKFAAHVEQEGLSYGTKEEYEFRMNIFQKTDAEINKINAEQDSFELGHNMFSTMTDAEAKRMFGTMEDPNPAEPTILDENNLEAGIDWRSRGAVNPI